MKNWLWLTLLSSLAFAAPPKVQNIKPGPIYVDVEPEQIIIYPEKIQIAKSDIRIPGGEFENFLARVEAVRETRNIVLLLRPGSAVFQRQLRQLIRDRGIDVTFEPWDAEREVVIPRPATTETDSPWLQSIAIPLVEDRAETSSNPIAVLVATPRTLPWNEKSPVFFECRNNQLFPISLERLKQICDEKTAELRETAAGDENVFLRNAAMTTLEIDGFRLDYTYALMGKYVLTTVKDAEGHPFGNDSGETNEWFDSQLAKLDPEKQCLCLFVRPDSLKSFEQARALAQAKHFIVTFDLFDENTPIMIGSGGERILAQ